MYHFITNNQTSFYLWGKELCSTIKKSQNIMNMIAGTVAGYDIRNAR